MRHEPSTEIPKAPEAKKHGEPNIPKQRSTVNWIFLRQYWLEVHHGGSREGCIPEQKNHPLIPFLPSAGTTHPAITVVLASKLNALKVQSRAQAANTQQIGTPPIKTYISLQYPVNNVTRV